MAPLMYVFLYILSVVEYLALLQSMVRLPRLRKSISGEQVTWASPERTGHLKGGRHRAETGSNTMSALTSGQLT
jgi:hypothetical protein